MKIPRVHITDTNLQLYIGARVKIKKEYIGFGVGSKGKIQSILPDYDYYVSMESLIGGYIHTIKISPDDLEVMG